MWRAGKALIQNGMFFCFKTQPLMFMPHQLMALCPEEDQLAVLAFATLPERKQVAETGTLASGRPSDLSNRSNTKTPVCNKPKRKRATIGSISKAQQPLPRWEQPTYSTPISIPTRK